VSLDAGKRPPQTRQTTQVAEFRLVFDLILIENDEIFLYLRDRYEIRHLCRGSFAYDFALAQKSVKIEV
jgi:hypothetical protein